MGDWDEIQDRLDELMDIQAKMDRLNERMEEMDILPEQLEEEIEKCRYELGAIREAELEELRREYERSVI